MDGPFFSIVTPVHNPPAEVLKAMLASVQDQTFADWEHCLVDDASSEPHVRRILERARRADPRVRVVYRDDNGGISTASNDGLAVARGEFVALLDHDDALAPTALAQVHETLVARPDTDYLYTDEDLVDERGRELSVFAKPGWSPERLRTQMYTLHLSVLRHQLVDDVGGFDPGFNGAQDWDLVLRVTERARHVAHVPQVLYHWRAVAGSTAKEGVDAKPWAFAAGTRALQAHCNRTGFQALVEHDMALPGIYRLTPQLRERPSVSIVIPTAGSRREVRGEIQILVAHCVESIVERSTYENYELVCVVDDHTDRQAVEQLCTIAGDRLRLIHDPQPFNFSQRVNLGALAASGDHLLILNDDMEVVTPNWIERLVMYSSHPGIGAVGAKLLFGDGRLQHVGVVFHSEAPGHIYRGFSGDHTGHWANTLVANNYLAVTGACLMSRREVFESVGGFCTLFPLNYNDVDYCLKLRAEGHRVVYDPDTVLYHFESSSRPEGVESWEYKLLMRRWEAAVRPDPYAHADQLHTADVDLATPSL